MMTLGHDAEISPQNCPALGRWRCRLPAVPRIARAQAYPTRPARIIVGFAAGGSTDTFARLIGQWLSSRLGQVFLIEKAHWSRQQHRSMLDVDDVFYEGTRS